MKRFFLANYRFLFFLYVFLAFPYVATALTGCPDFNCATVNSEIQARCQRALAASDVEQDILLSLIHI